MLRSVLAMSWLVVACSSSAPPPSPPPAQQGAAPEPTTLAAGDDAWLVGVLGQTGSLECVHGESRRWVDVAPTIGSTSITAGELAEDQFDRPVIARGRIVEDPPARPSERSTQAEPCPPAQMRSDWIETPRGVRMDRDGSPRPLPHFAVQELRPLAELAVQTSGVSLTVDFRNPLPVELHGVELRMHYEGCHGKPGTAMERHTVGTLAIGAGTRASFPAIVQSERAPGRPEPHRAFSLQVIAQGEHAHVDLDVRVGELGAAVKCPGE
jgi:hypothetical protein